MFTTGYQVVKEEVVESCIIEDNGNVVEMTLPNNCFTTTNIINSLPQVWPTLFTSSTSQPNNILAPPDTSVHLPVDAAEQLVVAPLREPAHGAGGLPTAINTDDPGLCLQPGLFPSAAPSPGYLLTTGNNY